MGESTKARDAGGPTPGEKVYMPNALWFRPNGGAAKYAEYAAAAAPVVARFGGSLTDSYAPDFALIGRVGPGRRVLLRRLPLVAARAATARGGLHASRGPGGSIFAWANDGHPLESNGERLSVVHPYDSRFGRLLKAEHRAWSALDPTEPAPRSTPPRKARRASGRMCATSSRSAAVTRMRSPPEGDTARVSPIFRWFADDFAASGGVSAFLRANAAAVFARRLEDLEPGGLSYLDYDWSLNDRARTK